MNRKKLIISVLFIFIIGMVGVNSIDACPGCAGWKSTKVYKQGAQITFYKQDIKYYKKGQILDFTGSSGIKYIKGKKCYAGEIVKKVNNHKVRITLKWTTKKYNFSKKYVLKSTTFYKSW